MQKAKRICFLKSLSVFVYAEMKAARETILKKDAKRSNFQESRVTTRNKLYNTNVFAKFIKKRSTVDDEF